MTGPSSSRPPDPTVSIKGVAALDVPQNSSRQFGGAADTLNGEASPEVAQVDVAMQEAELEVQAAGRAGYKN